MNIINFFPYPDHYSYNKKEMNNLINYAKKNNAVLVSTLKDKQRINIDQRKKISFLDLKIEVKEEKNLINFLKKRKIV